MHRWLLLANVAWLATGCTLLNGFDGYSDIDRMGGTDAGETDAGPIAETDAGPRPTDAGPGPEQDAGSTPDPALDLTLGAALLRPTSASSVPLEVTIERLEGLTGAVSVSASALPSGVTATDLTIAAGDTMGTLTFTDDGSAALEVITTITVTATSVSDPSVLRSRTIDLQVVGGAPGSLDTRFGTGGVFTYDLPTTSGFPLAAELTGDASLVIGGYSGSGVSQRGYVMVLDEAGALDASFGGTGVVEPVTTTGASQVRSLLVQDSRIVYGYVINEGGSRTAVNFSALSYAGATQALGAIAELELPTGNLPDIIEETSDGFVVLSGQLTRYLNNGSLVPSYGPLTTPDGFWGTEIVVDPMDRVITSVLQTATTPRPSVLRRWTSSGAVDDAFEAASLVQLPLGSDQDARITDLMVREDGSGVAVGYSKLDSSAPQRGVLVTFTASGAAEPAVIALGGSLETRGMRYITNNTDEVAFPLVESLPDGASLVAAYQNSTSLLIRRFERDGTGGTTLPTTGSAIGRPELLVVSERGWFIVIGVTSSVLQIERRWY